MDSKTFFEKIRGQRAAFCGIGRSNLPLMKIFAEKGAIVTACDKRTRDQLGETADQLESMGIALKLGATYLDDLDVRYDLPHPGDEVPSAGARQGKGARDRRHLGNGGVFRPVPVQDLRVTGSDGKTTTTTIIAEMLRAAGKRPLGGNIGKPLLPEIESIGPDDAAVVELSSFQLISMRRSPDVAVVTNLAPNHLDIHKDMDEYVNAKKNILLHQNAFGRAVLNLDNDITAGFASDVRGICGCSAAGGKPPAHGCGRTARS